MVFQHFLKICSSNAQYFVIFYTYWTLQIKFQNLCAKLMLVVFNIISIFFFCRKETTLFECLTVYVQRDYYFELERTSNFVRMYGILFSNHSFLLGITTSTRLMIIDGLYELFCWWIPFQSVSYQQKDIIAVGFQFFACKVVCSITAEISDLRE